jgi:hypothetical protein
MYSRIIKKKHDKRAREHVCQFDWVLIHPGQVIKVTSLSSSLLWIVLHWSSNELWYTKCSFLYLLILVFEGSSIHWGSHSSSSRYCSTLSSIFCTSFVDTLSVAALLLLLLLLLIFQYIKYTFIDILTLLFALFGSCVCWKLKNTGQYPLIHGRILPPFLCVLLQYCSSSTFYYLIRFFTM